MGPTKNTASIFPAMQLDRHESAVLLQEARLHHESSSACVAKVGGYGGLEAECESDR